MADVTNVETGEGQPRSFIGAESFHVGRREQEAQRKQYVDKLIAFQREASSLGVKTSPQVVLERGVTDEGGCAYQYGVMVLQGGDVYEVILEKKQDSELVRETYNGELFHATTMERRDKFFEEWIDPDGVRIRCEINWDPKGLREQYLLSRKGERESMVDMSSALEAGKKIAAKFPHRFDKRYGLGGRWAIDNRKFPMNSIEIPEGASLVKEFHN